MQTKARTDFECAVSCANSQMEVADKLKCGLRSAQKYIYGEAYPPCDVIAAVAHEFGSDWYALKHLLTVCPIAPQYMPQAFRALLYTSMPTIAQKQKSPA